MFLGDSVDWIDSNANKFVDELDTIACSMTDNQTESSDLESSDDEQDQSKDETDIEDKY